MEKQKICIIGADLTGLVTAITLSKLNLKIDLIAGNINQDIIDIDGDEYGLKEMKYQIDGIDTIYDRHQIINVRF